MCCIENIKKLFKKKEKQNDCLKLFSIGSLIFFIMNETNWLPVTNLTPEYFQYRTSYKQPLNRFGNFICTNFI
jgi:hypothetical protein